MEVFRKGIKYRLRLLCGEVYIQLKPLLLNHFKVGG